MKQNKIKLSEQQFLQVCEDFIDKELLDIEYYMVLEQPFVHKPSNYNDCNTIYIEQNNILMQELPRQGGTIVGSPGDVECIYFITKQQNTGMPEEIQNLVTLLLSKGLRPQIDNNDILINNYKVASWSTKKLKENILIAVVASVNLDMELIQNICLKTMDKVPKALSDFGITSEEVQRVFGLIN